MDLVVRFTIVVIAVLGVLWAMQLTPRAGRASEKPPVSTTLRFASGR